MEIWLDTANLELIHAEHPIPIRGITTNPTIAGNSQHPLDKLIEQILTLQKGCLCVQVVSDDLHLIIEQAQVLLSISDRIIPKIQVTKNGLQAITYLSQRGAKILATAIIEARQALLAFLAGASYLAPYMGKIEELGQDPIEVIKAMQKIKLENDFFGKIMAAGVRKAVHVTTCSQIGVDAITLSEAVYREFIADNETTRAALRNFELNWQKAAPSPLFSLEKNPSFNL